MSLFRFSYADGDGIHRLIFACAPRDALAWAAAFARATSRELLAIAEIRTLTNQLRLT